MSAQCLAALQVANAQRAAMAEAKRDLMAGRLTLAQALDDPRAQRLTIGDVLRHQPWRGPVRTLRILRAARIDGYRRVDSLPDGAKARLLEVAA